MRPLWLAAALGAALLAATVPFDASVLSCTEI